MVDMTDERDIQRAFHQHIRERPRSARRWLNVERTMARGLWPPDVPTKGLFGRLVAQFRGK